jgi:hypothetical protein
LNFIDEASGYDLLHALLDPRLTPLSSLSEIRDVIVWMLDHGYEPYRKGVWSAGGEAPIDMILRWGADSVIPAMVFTHAYVFFASNYCSFQFNSLTSPSFIDAAR